jgi:hypothetical protein
MIFKVYYWFANQVQLGPGTNCMKCIVVLFLSFACTLSVIAQANDSATT